MGALTVCECAHPLNPFNPWLTLRAWTSPAIRFDRWEKNTGRDVFIMKNDSRPSSLKREADNETGSAMFFDHLLSVAVVHDSNLFLNLAMMVSTPDFVRPKPGNWAISDA